MMGKRMHKMGTLITLKENMFKQKNKISRTPIYPIFFSELTVIPSVKMDYISHHLSVREGKNKKH